MVLIVTDGAVDLPAALAASPLVQRVEGRVWFGDAPFGGDAPAFWREVRAGNHASTTPPTVSDLMAAYASADRVVAVHVSGMLSATMARATEAAKGSGVDVTVVDSRSFSVGAGLAVVAAHEAALVPGLPEAAATVARSIPERLHTFAVVQDVDSLRRSDRSSLVPSSHLAHAHPLVLAVRGRVLRLDQPKHRARAIDALVPHVLDSAGSVLGAWAFGHGDAADAGAVVARLTDAFGQPPRYQTLLDPAVGSHLGPDALVVGALAGPIDLPSYR